MVKASFSPNRQRVLSANTTVGGLSSHKKYVYVIEIITLHVDSELDFLEFHSKNMSASRESRLYRIGENPQQVAECRRMRMWSGDAVDEVLNKEEVKTMAKIWYKEKFGFRKLTTKDILMLVEFAERIRLYRAANEREKCRQRMERSREKLRKAAEDGDSVAIRKLKKIKKSAKKGYLSIPNESESKSLNSFGV